MRELHAETSKENCTQQKVLDRNGLVTITTRQSTRFEQQVAVLLNRYWYLSQVCKIIISDIIANIQSDLRGT